MTNLSRITIQNKFHLKKARRRAKNRKQKLNLERHLPLKLSVSKC
jgi:hypothetical protein